VVASSSVICSGQTTTLTPSGAVSYTLSSSSTTFTSNVAVSPMTTTVYNISGSDASNCISGIKSITITVNITPTVALSASSASICLGNTATVTPSGANAYTLLNTGESITTNTVVSPISTTVYTVTGTSTAGCLSSPSALTVAVNSNPTLTLSTSSATICDGSSIILTALGTDTYTWTSGPNTNTFVVSPSSATVYTVVGTNTLTGCVSSTSTSTISVNPTPVLTVSATALSVCSNGTVNLNVNGATTYTWSGTGISGLNVNSSNPIFAAPSSNTYVYSVIGTNTVNCPSAVNTITINIVGAPNSSLVVSLQSICEGGIATFSIFPQAGVTYNWSSPSVLSNTTGVYVVPGSIASIAGTYSVNVTAILGTGSNTCSTSSTGNLVVLATPTISLSQNTISVCDGESVSMNVSNPLPSPANYNWSYNNTNGTFITIPQISLSESGTYTVTVTDANGCVNNSQFEILVKSCGYEIPVLLTPNDDGKNDAFVIKNIQLYPNCKVQIFNRWGNAIYSKVGYQNDWKGTFDLGNGGKLPAATYFILIEFNDGETKPYQGYIQIEY
jgi:gliding motility-associated-like protein